MEMIRWYAAAYLATIFTADPSQCLALHRYSRTQVRISRSHVEFHSTVLRVLGLRLSSRVSLCLLMFGPNARLSLIVSRIIVPCPI